jgi:hypothetical protein
VLAVEVVDAVVAALTEETVVMAGRSRWDAAAAAVQPFNEASADGGAEKIFEDARFFAPHPRSALRSSLEAAEVQNGSRRFPAGASGAVTPS